MGAEGEVLPVKDSVADRARVVVWRMSFMEI